MKELQGELKKNCSSATAHRQYTHTVSLYCGTEVAFVPLLPIPLLVMSSIQFAFY